MRELLGFWKVVSVETYLMAGRPGVQWDGDAVDVVYDATQAFLGRGLVRTVDIEAAYTYARERWSESFDRDPAVAA